MPNSEKNLMPSDQQIREFWEWCGFRFKLSASENPHYWLNPQGEAINRLPPLDLNNLFKYAVPKVTNVQLWNNVRWSSKKEAVIPTTYVATVNYENKFGSSENDDPALALFWAIWGVIHYQDTSDNPRLGFAHHIKIGDTLMGR